ncbi:unnamed protein product, partial [Rotaria sordida]
NLILNIHILFWMISMIRFKYFIE